jgi:hypothetical protein
LVDPANLLNLGDCNRAGLLRNDDHMVGCGGKVRVRDRGRETAADGHALTITEEEEIAEGSRLEAQRVSSGVGDGSAVSYRLSDRSIGGRIRCHNHRIGEGRTCNVNEERCDNGERSSCRAGGEGRSRYRRRRGVGDR